MADASFPRDVYNALPKVELHCHVEGTIRATTVVELARKAKRRLPTDDPRDLYRYSSLDSFLAVFWLVQEMLRTPDDWERIAYESLVDAAPHGLRYREMFFTPALQHATSRPGRTWPRSWPASRVESQLRNVKRVFAACSSRTWTALSARRLARSSWTLEFARRAK